MTMRKPFLKRALIRVLGLMARFVPGSETVRPFLHRLRGVQITGRVFIGDDVYIENEYPEFIELREGAQIGLRSILIAHTRGPGRIVIGKRAFLGANCMVLATPGTTITIGDGAVVSASSVIAADVPAHTFMGCEKAKPMGKASVPLAMGTSWESFLAGLAPLELPKARPSALAVPFVRNERQSKEEQAPAGIEPTDWPGIRHGPPLGAEFSDADLEQARRIVAFSLGLEVDLARDPSVVDHTLWDSLGQVSITTALLNRYGVLGEKENASRLGSRLRTIGDVAKVVAAYNGSHSDEAGLVADRPVSSFTKKPAPVKDVHVGDSEMLPLADPVEVTRALMERFLEPLSSVNPLRVVIAASFTAQPIANTVRVWGRAFGLELVCEFAGFGQVMQTLLAEDGAFVANKAGVNVVLMDPTDRIFLSNGNMSGAMDEVLAAIEEWRPKHTSSGQMLVGTLPPIVSAVETIDRPEYEKLRHRWSTRLQEMDGVRIFHFAEVVEQLGVLHARDSEGDILARMPYSPSLYQSLAIRLVREIVATRRSPAKVIAVDCDNTLWGEVVGEVGLEGIALGSDGIGRAFQLLQRQLRRLKEQGLLLAVVSQNEEADVRNVFENHPEMVLRADDIAAWRVNWKHKSENLLELAKEMNLGIDSFVFLDDDAAVRQEVSMRLPGVHVVPLPLKPSLYCEALGRLWLFDGAQVTEADLNRTKMMQEENRRQREFKAAATLEDYLAGLELQVEMRGPAESELARVAQLTQRTNQFNLSLKRRTVEEVRSLTGSCSVLICKARDKFGDYGLVGACVLANAKSEVCEVETLLMSCRVLGRGVENAFLHAIARRASEQGASMLIAPFVEGQRNQLVKDFLIQAGFHEAPANGLVLTISQLPPLPKHIRWRTEAEAATGKADTTNGPGSV
jgi:FkbH-like protein